MIKAVVLDTGVLGKLVRPKRFPEVSNWVLNLVQSGAYCCLPEIADYELRRELLLQDFSESVRRLDELQRALTFLPLDTETMHLAARLWADIRGKGTPTADRHALDGDVILAAQAKRLRVPLGLDPREAVDFVVATTNVGHLGRLVTAGPWDQIRP